MPYITIESGLLTKDQKEKLIKRLTEVSSEVTNIPQEFFMVTIKELPDTNIGIGGKIYKACLDRRRGQAWTDSCYRRGEGTRGIDRVYHHKLNKARQEIARLI